MRVLAVLAVLAAALWGGYWVTGRAALDRAIVTSLAATPEFTVDGHAISGFPNRFDVTLDAPALRLGDLGWSAPFLQVFALTYRPHHLLAVFAHDQRLVLPGLDAAIHHDDLRMSAVMAVGLDLPLDRLTLVGREIEIATDDARHRAEALRAASRRVGDTVHELALVLETVLPDPATIDRLDPQRQWPRRFDLLRLDAEVEFDRPLDRHLLAGARPVLRRITLTGFEARFDNAAITVTGHLTPGADGRLSGEIAVSVRAWRDLMQRARAIGLMPPDHDALMAIALQGLVSADDPDRLDAAFAVQSGTVRMGPLVVGQLPPLF